LTASYNLKVFNTTNADIAALRDWSFAQDCRDVCIELTGKYWLLILYILEPRMYVILTHKYVKAIKGSDSFILWIRCNSLLFGALNHRTVTLMIASFLQQFPLMNGRAMLLMGNIDVSL